MAERWAVATGSWSDTATWNGGTLPGASDDVHANGFTVTINQDVTVLSLRTTAGTTPVAGGGFTTSGTCEVNAESIAGTSQCLAVNNGGIQNGNSTGGSASNAYGSYVQNGGIQNGNSTGGSASHAYGSYVQNGGIQNGNSTGGSAINAHGSVVNSGGIQNGNSTGGSASGAHGSYVQSGGIQNGNSTGGSAASAYGSFVQSGGIQNGNSTGGSASGAHGSYVLSGGIVICHGATDDIGNGIQVTNDATVILGPGVTTADLYITGTRYIIGNANHPFVSLLKSTVSFG